MITLWGNHAMFCRMIFLGFLILLAGCQKPPSIIINDLGYPVRFKFASSKSCESSSGTIPVDQPLVLGCRASSLTAFSYYLKDGGQCDVDIGLIKRSVILKKTSPIVIKPNMETVRLSAVAC